MAPALLWQGGRAERGAEAGEGSVEETARILVGIDFSEGAAQALKHARVLADRFGGVVVPVHVVDGYPRTGPTEVRAREWLEGAGLELPDMVVRHGSAWVELVRYARETGPMMIVMGSHGASGFQPLSLGSTVSRLGVLSPYPVLVVTSAETGVAARAKVPAAAAATDRREAD